MGLDIWFERKTEKYKEVNNGYFRKVNFIVAYCENVGIGCREDREIEFTKDNCLDLIERCKKVLKYSNLVTSELENCEDCMDDIEETLPTTSGFFFGNTNYDEYYFKDVLEVKTFLTEDLLPQYYDLDENEKIVINLSW